MTLCDEAPPEPPAPSTSVHGAPMDVDKNGRHASGEDSRLDDALDAELDDEDALLYGTSTALPG